MPQIRLCHGENLSAIQRRSKVIYALILLTIPFLRVGTVLSLAVPYLSFLLYLFLFSVSSLPHPSPKKKEKKEKSIVQIDSEISLDKTPVFSPRCRSAAGVLAVPDLPECAGWNCLFRLEVCGD